MVIEPSIPQRIWIEMHDKSEHDACDVIVQMEDGNFYTAMFVTLPYLRRQMELSYEVSRGMRDMPPVRYAAMEVPHILVESLSLDTIEDTIDNLLSLETFATLFTKVIEDEVPVPSMPMAAHEHRLSTAEMAAVVVTEVLHTEDDVTVA
jgi:hypothetical protein